MPSLSNNKSSSKLISTNKTRMMPYSIGFLLIDNFALMSFSAVIEPLRAANLISKKQSYDINYYSADNDKTTSSSGAIVQATKELNDFLDLDILFVVAGFGSESFHNKKINAWLHKLSNQGVILGGVSGGPVILAKAGLMTNRRLTVHWEHAAILKETMPDLIIEKSLYVKDRDRYTCAGGIAPLDMMNSIITEHYGFEFAQKVSDWFIHTEIRPSASPQRAGLAERYPSATQAMILSIEAMNNHIADPLDLEQIARLSGISTRQLNRLFSEKMGKTTMSYYQSLRLRTAQRLLKQSALKVIEVAYATGFVNAAHFSSVFNKEFGKTPSAIRKESNST